MDEEVWPLFGLEVRGPGLLLSYVDDHLGCQLAQLAARGIHDSATMPFSEPWTDVNSPELERNTLRYYRRCRAETTEVRWTLNFAVSHRGEIAGMCTVSAEDFAGTKTAETGSWLGRSYQGRGLGREIRRAALYLIFVGFGAERATTSAWHDNAASLGVTRSLGYTADGSRMQQRRDRQDTMLDFSMTKEHWLSSGLDTGVAVSGIEPVRQLLGMAHSAVARRSR